MNFVFLGPPGSGKGTQAARLSEELTIAHLSTGDLLRAAVNEKTELGGQAESFMSRGELVPDELIIGMIEEKLSQGGLDGGFILDGFPRTIPQARSLREMLDRHSTSLDLVILLQVSDATVIKRLTRRAEIEGRTDDTEAVILNRLEVYRQQTKPIEDFYRQESILTEIVGEDTPDRVYEAIRKVAIRTMNA